MLGFRRMLLAGAGCAAISLASFAGCSSSSSGLAGNDGGGADVGSADVTMPLDAAADTATDQYVADTFTQDDDTSPETGGDAAACGAIGGDGGAGTFTTNSAACDACLAANCCPQFTACATPDDAGTEDGGGLSACSAILRCSLACVLADAGTGQACFTACASKYPSGASAASAAGACIGTHCISPCPN
jgi:hypothetical protein